MERAGWMWVATNEPLPEVPDFISGFSACIIKERQLVFVTSFLAPCSHVMFHK